MTYLLDTHVLLWAALEPKKLSKAARKLLDQPEAHLLLSIVSLWEIGILKRLGRIDLTIGIAEIADLSIAELGTELVGIQPRQIDRMQELPFHHRDPFDRLLIAQAVDLKVSLISKDETFSRYGIDRIW